jgi:hypothetical protein
VHVLGQNAQRTPGDILHINLDLVLDRRAGGAGLQGGFCKTTCESSVSYDSSVGGTLHNSFFFGILALDKDLDPLYCREEGGSALLLHSLPAGVCSIVLGQRTPNRGEEVV